MPTPKIDIKLLDKYLNDDGKTATECAEIFNVSQAAITHAKKRLTREITVSTAIDHAPEVCVRHLNTIEQLYNINQKVIRVLDEAEKDPRLILSASAEIRNQLKLQLEMYQALYDIRAAQEFQEEVLNIIGEVDENARTRIIERLQKRRAIRAIITQS